MNKRTRNKLAKKKIEAKQAAFTASPAGEVSARSERVQKSVKASVAELAGEVRDLAIAVGKMAELEVEKAVAKIPIVGDLAAGALHRIAAKA